MLGSSAFWAFWLYQGSQPWVAGRTWLMWLILSAGGMTVHGQTLLFRYPVWWTPHWMNMNLPISMPRTASRNFGQTRGTMVFLRSCKQRWHWPVVDDVLKSTASSKIFQDFPGWMTKGYFVVFLVVTASDSPHNIPPGSTWRKIGGLNESEWLFEDVRVPFWGISFLNLSCDLSYPAHLFLTLWCALHLGRVHLRAAAAVRDQNFATQVVTGVFVDNAFRCAEKQRSLVTWCS